MFKRTQTVAVLPVLAFALTFTACDGVPGTATAQQTIIEQYTPGLAVQMKDMQYWSHKLALSVGAENAELADFYHHELEEAVEDLIDSIETYDGFAIAQLTEVMLVPTLDAVEDAIDEGDWTEARSAVSAMVQSCNACHVATDHGFIRITEGFDVNPFNQSFAP